MATNFLMPGTGDDAPSTEREMLEKALRMLDGCQVSRKGLSLGSDARLTPDLVELLHQAVEAKLEGQIPTIVSRDRELSPRQAAELLNVSRPYVVKLIETHELPGHKVGAHHRIHLKDVLDYQDRLKVRQNQALDFLAAQSQDLEQEDG